MDHRVVASCTVFDHIPKTAGTSISAAMTAALGEAAPPPEPSLPHYIAIRTPRGRFVSSHLWFYPGEPLALGWFYATLLREPVDRILSLFHFHRASPGGTRGEHDPHLAAARLGLEYYVSLGSGHGGLPDNAQAIHFAWRMCDAPECLKHADLLAAAVASLEAYDLVGTFTDVQGFTDRYCDALAVARRQVPRLNVTTARARQTPVSPGVINRLRARNTVDAALYEWARQRFSGPWRPPVRTRVTPGPVDFGNRAIEILSVDCRSSEHSDGIRAGADVVIQIGCLAHREEPNLTVGIAIRSERDEHVFGTNSRLMGVPLNVSAAQSFVVTLTLQVGLPAGCYRITLALHKGLTHQEGCYHWREDTTPLIIRPAGLSNEAGSSYTAGRDREETAVTIAYRPIPRSSFAKYLSD